MALTSPGVEVTVIDESQYLPGAPASIPFFLLATAQDKADPTSTGTAAATTAANANKLFRVTSQRDLVTLYGNPFFYTTSAGTPIQGYELNEYGLLAAYSALGISNQVFCLRADVDLASLVGSTGRPTGAPEDGSYWLDTTNSTWGINEFNATTGTFATKNPIVITDADLLTAGAPLASVGSIGDYAVVAIANYNYPSASTAPQYFYKTMDNIWSPLGSPEWAKAWPTLQGTNSNPALTPGDTFEIQLNGTSTATITVQSAPNNTIAQVASDINALNWKYIYAGIADSKLTIYSGQTGGDDSTQNYYLRVFGSTGTALEDLGFTSDQFGFQPRVAYGTSAQQPLWQQTQNFPAPTGSVWIKVGLAGNGLNPDVSQYDATSASYVPKNMSFAMSDWAVTSALDSTGGQAIPAGSVYTQYGFNGGFDKGPLYFWYRSGTGPMSVKGLNTAPDFTNGPYTAYVQVSTPGSSTLTSPYPLYLADNSDATDFVTAWSAANIPYTSAQVNDDGSISIVHTAGGVIVLDDFDTSTGESQDLWSEAGFTANSTPGAKYGPAKTDITFQPLMDSTTGSGSGLQISVTNNYQDYDFVANTVVSGGSGFAVGDRVTFLGSDMGGASPANDLTITVTGIAGGAVTDWTWYSGEGNAVYMTQLSNWYAFDLTGDGANSLTSNEGEPTAIPENLTNWFYSSVDQVDIMINFNGAWRGYKNQGYDANGFPSPTITNATDPNGPIVSASEPTEQSDGTALNYGDLWIDTTDLENYPVIWRWQAVEGVDRWVRIDNTDQINSNGILFADARWATNGTTNPANDPIPSISALLASDYLDIDAPDESLYPTGMLLFNSRRSGYNVKQYRVNWFNSDRFPTGTIPTQKDAWVSASGLQSDGAPFMGRKAQRAMVVQAMRAAIDTNTAIRDEDNFFNLQAAPNYPELQPNMVVLNSDRGETSYIVGDTPMRLSDSATDIQAWATNAAGATSTGEDGCVTRNTYLGLFYPSGITSDLSGNLVAVPSSHMMVRTMLRNDTIAYPWLAPAGTRRGIIDNATNIGYVDRESGEFQVIKTRIGIRDVLYTNFINPLVFFTGNGLLNYGNKTSFDSQSALDRINVARLVAYIRRQLTIAARPFVFEPNDVLTRNSIKAVIETLFQDLVAKRGLYDYSVVCDESNNTPARIDRNELWIDIAVEPVKAAEFIYIPVRIFNTGELSGAQ